MGNLVIGLSGYARSGKDTVADILVNNYSFTRLAFADKVREFLYASDDAVKFVVDEVGWERAKNMPSVRRALQTTGLAAREVFGQNFWVDQIVKSLDDLNLVVITDVRFKNEADKIRNRGGYVWRITRNGVGPVNDHISELDLDDYEFDLVLNNNHSLDTLEKMVYDAYSDIFNAYAKF